jgi:hypothetical protein
MRKPFLPICLLFAVFTAGSVLSACAGDSSAAELAAEKKAASSRKAALAAKREAAERRARQTSYIDVRVLRQRSRPPWAPSAPGD